MIKKLNAFPIKVYTSALSITVNSSRYDLVIFSYFSYFASNQSSSVSASKTYERRRRNVIRILKNKTFELKIIFFVFKCFLSGSDLVELGETACNSNIFTNLKICIFLITFLNLQKMAMTL
jgi:hypothetical protein